MYAAFSSFWWLIWIIFLKYLILWKVLLRYFPRSAVFSLSATIKKVSDH